MPQETAWFPTGAWRVKTASRRRRCRKDWRHHRIEKGQLLLEITNSGTGAAWVYCRPCAIALLERAAAGIGELRSQLDAQPPGQAGAGA
jgi:hypothetical protein